MRAVSSDGMGLGRGSMHAEGVRASQGACVSGVCAVATCPRSVIGGAVRCSAAPMPLAASEALAARQLATVDAAHPEPTFYADRCVADPLPPSPLPPTRGLRMMKPWRMLMPSLPPSPH